MRELLVIGMGPGHPDQITVQAVQALNRIDVLFRIDKGDAKSGLNAVRDEILHRHVIRPGYRVVEIPEPPRDRSPADYEGAVRDWHEARAELIETAIADELGQDGVGGFLVWGDPSVYDSTLRIIDRILARGAVPFEYTVIPGVTSVQALAAAHRVPLNRIGEPIYITPARRIAGGLPEGVDSAVVMLDSGFTAAGLDDPALTVFWGAYLSTPDETLIRGPLSEVAAEITATRAALRARHGWIMDTYLLRRNRDGRDNQGPGPGSVLAVSRGSSIFTCPADRAGTTSHAAGTADGLSFSPSGNYRGGSGRRGTSGQPQSRMPTVEMPAA